MTYFRVGETNLNPSQLHPFKMHGMAAFAGALALTCGLLMGINSVQAGPITGDVHGVTLNVLGAPLPGAQVSVHSMEDNTDRNIISDADGTFVVDNLRPGRYQLRAAKKGLASPSVTTVNLAAQQDLRIDMTLVAANGPVGATGPSVTADLHSTVANGNPSAAPLTDREKHLLDRLDQLEKRLEAMEARDVKAAAPAAPATAPPPVTAPSKSAPATVAATQPAPAPVAKPALIASLERAVGVKSAEKIPALPPVPQAQDSAAATPPQHVLPEALEAPDPAPPNSDNVYSYADFTWLNGTFAQQRHYSGHEVLHPGSAIRHQFHGQSFNQPKDHTMGGATESFRSGEFQVEQASVGGDFHWQNVRGRILTMDGLFAATTPRNDASAGVGQWDVRTALPICFRGLWRVPLQCQPRTERRCGNFRLLHWSVQLLQL